jgi:hypothetical protein
MVTIYPSSMGVPPAREVGLKTLKGMGESTVGSVVVFRGWGDRLWMRDLQRRSEGSYGWNPRRSRTETVVVAVVDGGDVAVYAAKGSPSDAFASGWNHQDRRGVH